MTLRVVLAHDEPAFARPLAEALSAAGYEVTAFTDPQSAWEAMDAAANTVAVDVLITRFRFGSPEPIGPSLARVARNRHPNLSVIFVTQQKFRKAAEAIGQFVAAPATVADVLAAVGQVGEKRAA